MKKTIAVSLILGVMLSIAGFVVATQDSFPADKRVIVPTTSIMDKFVFKLKGCKIIHELNDATALKCPSRVQIERAFEDKRYHIMDADANIQINADDVWELGYTGEGVTVAVLDTGIDTDHPELVGSIAGGQGFGYATYEDDNGHGTHVSGIITANGVVDDYSKGVSPGAKIWAGKVLDSSGSGWASEIALAIEYVVYNNKADVISMSLGGGNFAGENCDTDYLAGKVNWAVDNGVTVVVASGNDRYYVSSPACASGAIAVGAVDKSGLMAWWSNFGPALDIVAPGVNIYSSIIGGYDDMSGTSMSTPHISGVVALILGANPDLTVSEIKTALYETANPINPDSVCYGVTEQKGAAVWIGEVECTSDNYGAGIVNAFGAVNYFTIVEPVCGNNIAESTEICDGTDFAGNTCETLGFDAGTLTCNPDCLGFDTTGCYDYVCGNEIIEGNEECDTTNLGESTCEILGYDEGILDCTEICTFDTSDCITIEPENYCGDNYCDGINLGEDCNTCPEDCPSKTTSKPSNRYCCGNLICESAELILGNCPVDCQ